MQRQSTDGGCYRDVSFQDADYFTTIAPIFVVCLEKHLATVSAESFTFI